MAPRPTCSHGSRNSTRRETAGREFVAAEACTVVVEGRVDALVLEEGELRTVLGELADTYGKSIANTARDVPSQAKKLAELFGDFGWSGRFYEKVIGGKRFVVFKGRAGLRKVLRGTRYLADHAKILSYGIGRQAVRHAVRSNAIVSFFFVTGYNVVETVIRDDKDFIDGAADVAIDLAKTIVTSVVGLAAGMAAAASAPVVVAVGVGIAVGIVVSFGLDAIDAEFAITASLRAYFRQEFERAAEELERTRQEAERTWTWCNSPDGALACMQRMFGGF